MNDKYIQTLLLFAQNYKITEIASELKVNVSAIKNNLDQIEKKHPFEFGNALSMREACKRLTKNIKEAEGSWSIDENKDEPLTKFIEPE